jgi:hypothetical protein
MKERKPQTIVMYIELEDNCGAILAKTKKEVIIETGGTDIDDPSLKDKFIDFVDGLPGKLSL